MLAPSTDSHEQAASPDPLPRSGGFLEQCVLIGPNLEAPHPATPFSRSAKAGLYTKAFEEGAFVTVFRLGGVVGSNPP